MKIGERMRDEKTTVATMDNTENLGDETLPHRAVVPIPFLVLSLVTSCFLSYGMGLLARSFILEKTLSSIMEGRTIPSSYTTTSRQAEHLPTPTVTGKVVPPTIYSTMNFDTRSSVISSQWLKNNFDEKQVDDEMRTPLNVKLTPVDNETDYVYDADDEEHLPAGQHLLIDINNVNGSFLNSEKQLATAMLDMVDTSGLTLLSYHCHGLVPSGVTCVGVLLESHVSFHTWPEEGVITLDLFTCGSTSLLNHLQLIQNLFAVPRRDVGADAEPPQILWAYKRRGFNEQSNRVGSRDTFAYPLGIHGIESKQEIATIMTETGKRGWVYDIERSSLGTQYADVPSRYFYLDGVLKASTDDGAVSDESFVHPAMLAHPNPKNVLILGSTTGASVKEVLKHNTVNSVSLLGVDEGMLKFAKESLQAWNDCSDILGVGNSCLDDPRVTPIYTDPNLWFHAPDHDRANFDVVLVDMFELDEEVVRGILDKGQDFFSGLKKQLNRDAVVAFRVGGVFRSVDSKVTASAKTMVSRRLDTEIRETLEREEIFFSQKEYKETFAGASTTRSFVVAFTNEDTANNWNRNEAQVNRMIRERFHKTASGLSLLVSFDGTTMVDYSKFQQDHRDCSSHPNPNWCDIQRKLRASKISPAHLIGEPNDDLEASHVAATCGENSSINQISLDLSTDVPNVPNMVAHEAS